MILLILLSISGGSVNLGYSHGSWEGWGGKGIYLGGGMYKEGDFAGIMGNTAIGFFSFGRGDTSTSFWRWNIGVSPYLVIPVPYKIRIGLNGGWNRLWGWRYSDPDIFFNYPLVLNLANWGLWIGTDYSLSPTMDIDFKMGFDKIIGFKDYKTFNFILGLNFHEYSAPSLIAYARFTDENGNGNGYLDAGETGEIVLKIQNKGNDYARFIGVQVIPSPDLKGRVSSSPTSISAIAPGKSKTVRIKLTASQNIPAGSYTFRVKGKGLKGCRFQEQMSIETKRGEPPYLIFQVVPEDENKNGIFEAGENVKMHFKIRNSGRGDAYKVKAVVYGPPWCNFSSYVGNLTPAQEKEIDVKFKVPLDVKTEKIPFSCKLEEAGGYAPPSRKVVIQVKALTPVSFVPSIIIDDDNEGISQGDGEGDMDIGETVELHINLANRGTGTARGIRAKLISLTDGVEVKTGVQSISSLSPMASQEITFVVGITQRVKENNIKFSLKITEETGKFTFTKLLSYPLGKPPAPEVVSTVETPKYPLRKNVYALVVGVSRYQDRALPSLRFAEQDASDIYKVITNSKYGAVPKENVTLLSGKDATFSRLRAELAELEEMADKGTYILIFFSTHGASKTSDRDRRGPYLLPYDAKVTSGPALKATSISLAEMKASIERMTAKGVLVMINACFSQMPAGVAGLSVKKISSLKKLGEGKIVLTASRGDQYAYDSREYGHSIFTYWLLQGLKGKADFNRDGKITAQELYKILKDNVPIDAQRLRRARQNPQIWGKGDFTVGKVRK